MCPHPFRCEPELWADGSKDGTIACLADEAREITDRALAESESRGAWEAVRETRRSELQEMLGLAADRP